MLWTKAGLLWLKSINHPEHELLVLNSELRQLIIVERERVMLDQQLALHAAKEPRVQLLMTIPGVNYVVALGILATLGDISRFQDGNHAAAYVGLAPSTRQSANHCCHGHITKQGSGLARGLLTQAAQHASRHAGPLEAFFRRLTKRKNHSVAITALARKLVVIAYLMLKNNEPYRYARPELMRTKFAKLDLLQPSKLPKWKHGQASPGLSKIYAAAGLPKVTLPDRLPASERRMLTNAKLADFVQELYEPPGMANEKSRNKTSATTSRRPKGRRS